MINFNVYTAKLISGTSGNRSAKYEKGTLVYSSNSIRRCARELNLKPGAICRALKKKRPTVKGFIFEYVC